MEIPEQLPLCFGLIGHFDHHLWVEFLFVMRGPQLKSSNTPILQRYVHIDHRIWFFVVVEFSCTDARLNHHFLKKIKRYSIHKTCQRTLTNMTGLFFGQELHINISLCYYCIIFLLSVNSNQVVLRIAMQ